MNDGKLQWHDAFGACLQIELGAEASKLEIEKEHLLGQKPMQIDFLILKKHPKEKIQKNIGKFFKEYNIIEYKSPDDYLSINNFYKAYGYACFYQSATKKTAQIDARELTISFVCNHYPVKMLEHIQSVRGIQVIQMDQGIYQLIGDPIAMQLIITKQLSKTENYWMQILRNDLKSGGEIKSLLERYEPQKNDTNYQAVMDVLTRANWEMMEEEKNMCDALRELFADELKEAGEAGEIRGRSAGKAEGRMQGLREAAINLSNMGIDISIIAQAVNMKETEVKSLLQNT